MKLGNKMDAFRLRGQAWTCTTGLPSDITIEVGEMSFHLHKFPLLSKGRVLEKLIKEKADKQEGCIINLTDIPGGAKAFELVAKFCYGVKLDLTASDVVYLCCVSQHLQMTEEIAEGNLISQSEIFLDQVVLRSWKYSIKALQTCAELLPYAEDLHIVKRCIESLAVKACTDPNLFGWPMIEHGSAQRPAGSDLWNGISTGARARSFCLDWWYDDVSSLIFPLYKRLISVMGSHGVKQDIIAGSMVYYAKRYLPGLNKRQGLAHIALSATPPCEDEQRDLLEEICNLLPVQKGVASTKFLFGLLRTAMILKANPSCTSNLERRIGMQLDEATLEDLLLPTFCFSTETLYNVECVERILQHFVAMDQTNGGASPCLVEDEQMIMGSPTPLTCVARLIDGYLAEVAPDVNLKLPKFQSLAAAVPDYARPIEDGLYRAIDIYLKAHAWLSEPEREQLCRLMDCQKLSLEACTHAAQNERLPLRVTVQVLFLEQLQLRTSIAGCSLVSDNLDGSRSGDVVGPTNGGGDWAVAVKENQNLKFGMDSMRMKVSELETLCSSLNREIERLGKGESNGGVWRSVCRRFGFGVKYQVCGAQEGSDRERKRTGKKNTEHERGKSTDVPNFQPSCIN